MNAVLADKLAGTWNLLACRWARLV